MKAALEEFEGEVVGLIETSSLSYGEIVDSLESLAQEYRAKATRDRNS